MASAMTPYCDSTMTFETNARRIFEREPLLWGQRQEKELMLLQKS